ncbi:MAG: metallophosphoesterase [Acidobacteria bacterium]|nr:metallophosphoesterase [Acidobacteriota bacterium]
MKTMDARALSVLYERHLAEDLEPPVAADVDRLGTKAMLRACRRLAHGELREEDYPVVWLWSDLHLGHSETINAFVRPFRSAQVMDDALFGRWRRVVGPEDAIVCLGDVAVHGLSGTRLELVRETPGWKVLVIGNHDVRPDGSLAVDAFDEVHSSLYVAGDPPLLMTHMPLRAVPEGCVNVHGHLHGARMPGVTPHINVSVEQTHYRPRPLTAIRRLAARLVRGEVVVGRTTAHQLAQVV